jgi:hemerythrin-like domain-containing protein
MLRDKNLIPLSHQHHNALALCVLTERSLRADRSEANLRRLARRCVERYEVELQNHFQLEETILFPILPDSLQADAQDLTREHRDLEVLIEKLRVAYEETTLRDFCSLLRRHIRKEESDLFQKAQLLLPKDLLETAGEELDRLAVRACITDRN